MRTLALMAAVGVAGCVAPAAAPPGVETVRAERKAGVAGAARAAARPSSWCGRCRPARPPGRSSGAPRCVADSPYFRAEFASPARILLPDFGAAAPAVTVTCRSGTASGTAVAAPQAAWQGGLGGWPAVGVSVGTGDDSGVGVGFGW